MIKAKEAISVARTLIGTPYPTKENNYQGLDCLNLIKKVIRKAPGGKPGYTTATTVSLWESIDMTSKYRDLTWRQESIVGALPGMLAFKRYNKSADHVGIVTERGTVIHSSSTHGMVVETELTTKEGWNGLGIIRHIETEDYNHEEVVKPMNYKVRVNLNNEDSTLNLRKSASTRAKILGLLNHGDVLTVIDDSKEGWFKVVTADDVTGWVDKSYTTDYVEDVDTVSDSKITIIDEEGNVFEPVGDFRVLRGSID